MLPLPAQSNYAAPASPSAWDGDTGSLLTQNDTAWLLSFIDILALLLTLFVLLLAFDRDEQPVEKVSLLAPQERGAEPVRQQMPARELPGSFFSALPMQVSDGFPLIDPRSMSEAQSIEELAGKVEPDPASMSNAVTPRADLPMLSQVNRRMTEVPLHSPLPATGSTLVPLLPETTSLASLTPALPPDETLPEVPQVTAPARQQEMAAAQKLLQNFSSALRNRLEISVDSGVINLQVSDSILFPAASATLTGPGDSVIEELAAALDDQTFSLSVEGHTDNLPIQTSLFPSNWELSSARAAAVTRALIERGIAPDRVRAIGYGDTRPRAENLSAEGRSKNRRVSFVLHLE
ncbi:MAG: OmpA family protein [Thiogranum sp.]|nr:OmpA family protein [Thiogranum sp.]